MGGGGGLAYNIQFFLYNIGSNCNPSKQPKDLPDYVFGCECMAHRGNWGTETKKVVPKTNSQRTKKTNTKRTKKTKKNNFPGLLICKLISTAFTESRKIVFIGSFGFFGIIYFWFCGNCVFFWFCGNWFFGFVGIGFSKSPTTFVFLGCLAFLVLVVFGGNCLFYLADIR